MEKLRSLHNRAKAKAHIAHHAHHYAELAYCLSALVQAGEHIHTITVGGLAFVVVISLICGE